MTKLAAQFLAAGLIAWQGVPIVSLPIGGHHGRLVVDDRDHHGVRDRARDERLNFIDGLDGLVAGVALIANGVFFLYTYLLVQQTSPHELLQPRLAHRDRAGRRVRRLPAAQLAPRELFMGDAGALLIGLLMATSADRGHGPDRPRGRSALDEFVRRPSSRSCCRSRCSSSRCSTSGSRSIRRCAPASRRSPPTASTCTTACSTWGTRTCTPC